MRIRNQFRVCYAIILAGIVLLPSCVKEPPLNSSTSMCMSLLPLEKTEREPPKGQIRDTAAFDSGYGDHPGQ